MSIEKAGLKDVEELAALVNSAYRGETARLGWTHESDLLTGGVRVTVSDLEEMISSPDSMILKYSEGGSITACVYLKEYEHYLYLGLLTVSPILQGRGIGKMLLQEAAEQAKSAGKHSIRMTVITRRKELVEWYIRQGYVDTGVREEFPYKAGYGEPAEALEFMVLEKYLQ